MVKKILVSALLLIALAACSDDSTAAAQPGLSGIEASSGTLTPTFSPDVTRYAITVPGSTTELSLTLTRTTPDVTVTATGAAQTADLVFTRHLTDGDNTVAFVVAAPDRPEVTYTVTITRPPTVVASRDGAAPRALVVTVPAAVAATAGDVATFATTASGGTAPYRYQWQVSGDGGTTFHDVAGATGASYTTAALGVGDNGNQYRVVVTDAASATATSNAATLTVKRALRASAPSAGAFRASSPPTTVPAATTTTAAPPTTTTVPPPTTTVPTTTPVRAGAPADVTSDAGQTATFSTTASDGTAPYTYQWQVSTGGAYTNVTSGTGGTTATYTTATLTTGSNGNTYRVIVTDSAPTPTSATSSAATLTVNPALSTSAPTDTATNAGQTATFSTTASDGTAPYTYQWQVSTGGSYSDVAGATGATYTTASLTTGDSGNTYRVIVTDSATVPTSVTSGAATLTVNAALSTSAPTDTATNAGQTATFSTTASNGTAPYTYQWQVSTGGSYSDVAGATGATYTTASLTTGESGNTYRVIVTDSAATPTSVTSGAATLTVNAALSTSTPANTTIDAGQTATFSVVASNGTAPYTYQWQVSTGGAYTNVSSGTGGTTATYTTGTRTTGNSGDTYRVIVTDSATVPTSVTSGAATLTVNAALSTSTPSNTTIDAGQTATFSVVASNGTAPYTYQWQVSTGGAYTNVSSGTGGTTATYTTGTRTTGNSGDTYRVIVTDSAAVPTSVTSGAATLTVNAALSTTSPSSTTIDAGQTATFSVVASNGTAPYTYQWQVSTGGAYTNVTAGTGGTTATYTTGTRTTGNSGDTYRVIVTDSAGVPVSVISASAMLTVTS